MSAKTTVVELYPGSPDGTLMSLAALRDAWLVTLPHTSKIVLPRLS